MKTDQFQLSSVASDTEDKTLLRGEKKKKSYSRRKTKVLVGKVENEVIIIQKIWKMASIRIGKEST